MKVVKIDLKKCNLFQDLAQESGRFKIFVGRSPFAPLLIRTGGQGTIPKSAPSLGWIIMNK